MLSHMKKGGRSHRAGLLLTLTALLTATAFTAACGDDGGDENTAGAGGDNGGSGGSSGSGTGNTGNILINMGGDNGSAGDMGQGGGCGESPFEADPVLVDILLVIDKSLSMDALLGGSSRWDAMKTAINSAVSNSGESISYGLLLYPDNATCGVPAGPDVAIASDSATDIADALDAADPDGATPTASALAAALDYYTEGDGADLEGLKYVLLATDGGPNCNQDGDTCGIAQCTFNIEEAFNPGVYEACNTETNCCDGDETQCLDDADTVAAIAALEAAGVTTIVVGIPGTEAYASLLDDMAEAGGSPNPDAPPSYYAVEDGDAGGLSEVLESITMNLIRDCEFQLASDPPDPDEINVKVDGETVPYDEEGMEGWTWDESTDPDTVVLVGDACTQVKEQGAESVEVTFGCPTIVIPK
jgi:hypothetical protein